MLKRWVVAMRISRVGGPSGFLEDVALSAHFSRFQATRLLRKGKYKSSTRLVPLMSPQDALIVRRRMKTDTAALNRFDRVYMVIPPAGVEPQPVHSVSAEAYEEALARLRSRAASRIARVRSPQRDLSDKW